RSLSEVRACVLEISRQLSASGYTVRDLLPKHYNLHVVDPATGIQLDLFPYWMTGDRFSLHMAKMRVEDMPIDVLEPVSSVTLEGNRFNGPADPERFLLARYGAGWP